jgi:hypothetical protein
MSSIPHHPEPCPDLVCSFFPLSACLRILASATARRSEAFRLTEPDLRLPSKHAPSNWPLGSRSRWPPPLPGPRHAPRCADLVGRGLISWWSGGKNHFLLSRIGCTRSQFCCCKRSSPNFPFWKWVPQFIRFIDLAIRVLCCEVLKSTLCFL